MSHKQTPYSPKMPSNQGYAMPTPESYPMIPQGRSQSPPPGYPLPGYPQPAYTPVLQQPGPQVPPGCMPNPQGLLDCPPGLEYLSTVDQLLIYQKLEVLEIISGFETNNKYTIKNNVGQKVFIAIEDNDCCTRNCCGPLRPFDMKILDNFNNEVIHLYRPFACQGCCCPCCLQTMEVTSPPGTVIGSIEQQWSFCKPSFVIKNAVGDIVLRIKGPLCICGSVGFQVYTADGVTEIGEVKKLWAGLVQELFTDADNFGISFPMDLDVKLKALLLGACFLIDFMYFEKSE